MNLQHVSSSVIMLQAAAIIALIIVVIRQKVALRRVQYLAGVAHDAMVGFKSKLEKFYLPRVETSTLDYPITEEEASCWTAVSIGYHSDCVLVCTRYKDEHTPVEHGEKVLALLKALGTGLK